MNLGNVEIFDTAFALTVLILIAIAIPLILLISNWILHPGRKKHTEIKGTPYECGLAHVAGTADERYPIKYYMVAMLFLVFDIEVAFLYPLAVVFLESSWSLLFVLLAFLLILESGYLYLYRKGVLDWNKISD